MILYLQPMPNLKRLNQFTLKMFSWMLPSPDRGKHTISSPVWEAWAIYPLYVSPPRKVCNISSVCVTTRVFILFALYVYRGVGLQYILSSKGPAVLKFWNFDSKIKLLTYKFNHDSQSNHDIFNQIFFKQVNQRFMTHECESPQLYRRTSGSDVRSWHCASSKI